MSRRTQNRNQYESTTTGELAAGAFTVTVDSTAGLITDEPIYFVIEPDIPGQREWIRVQSITGNQLNIANPNGRDLTGSDGDLTHPAGSKVRSVPTQQIFEDIFSDAEDDELALTQHQTDGGDPHAQAGYLTENDSNLLYVKLSGSTMTGDLILFQDPSLALGAATKQYVDGFLPLTGGILTGLLELQNGLEIDNASSKDSFKIGGTPLGDEGVSSHVLAWNSGTGVVAREIYDGPWLPLAGGAMSGELNMDGNQIFGLPAPINDGDAASKGYVDSLTLDSDHTTFFSSGSEIYKYTLIGEVVTLHIQTTLIAGALDASLPANILPGSGDLDMWLGRFSSSGVGLDGSGTLRVRSTGGLFMANTPDGYIPGSDTMRGTFTYLVGADGA